MTGTYTLPNSSENHDLLEWNSGKPFLNSVRALATQKDIQQWHNIIINIRYSSAEGNISIAFYLHAVEGSLIIIFMTQRPNPLSSMTMFRKDRVFYKKLNKVS